MNNAMDKNMCFLWTWVSIYVLDIFAVVAFFFFILLIGSNAISF